MPVLQVPFPWALFVLSMLVSVKVTHDEGFRASQLEDVCHEGECGLSDSRAAVCKDNIYVSKLYSNDLGEVSRVDVGGIKM